MAPAGPAQCPAYDRSPISAFARCDDHHQTVDCGTLRGWGVNEPKGSRYQPRSGIFRFTLAPSGETHVHHRIQVHAGDPRRHLGGCGAALRFRPAAPAAAAATGATAPAAAAALAQQPPQPQQLRPLQQPQQPPQAQQPAPAQKVAPAKPYAPIAVTLPKPYVDPAFEAFRKQLGAIAARKDRGALARLVANDFFWMGEKGDKANKKKPGIDNLAAAIGLDAKDGPGWEMLVEVANKTTLETDPGPQGHHVRPG